MHHKVGAHKVRQITIVSYSPVIQIKLYIFRELSICFESARWDHPERNIKSSKTKY